MKREGGRRGWGEAGVREERGVKRGEGGVGGWGEAGGEERVG